MTHGDNIRSKGRQEVDADAIPDWVHSQHAHGSGMTGTDTADRGRTATGHRQHMGGQRTRPDQREDSGRHARQAIHAGAHDAGRRTDRQAHRGRTDTRRERVEASATEPDKTGVNDRQADSPTDRRPDRPTIDRPTDRQVDRRAADRQTDKTAKTGKTGRTGNTDRTYNTDAETQADGQLDRQTGRRHTVVTATRRPGMVRLLTLIRAGV